MPLVAFISLEVESCLSGSAKDLSCSAVDTLFGAQNILGGDLREPSPV